MFKAFDRFQLDNLSILNERDKYYERSELTESSLYTCAATLPESVEETVMKNLQHEALYEAIRQLPETQRRRMVLYSFKGITYEQIVEIERCSHPSVIKSVNDSIEKIKKIFSD